MKQLLILDKQFNIKTIKVINDFYAITDVVTPQKVSLKILNAKEIETKDICVIKDNNNIQFIGIIKNIKVESYTTLDIYSFYEIFNQNLIFNNVNGDVYNFLSEVIMLNFTNSDDNNFKLNLAIKNNLNKNYFCSATFSDNNFLKALNNIYDVTGCYFNYNLLTENGHIIGIELELNNIYENDVKVLKYNMPIIISVERNFTQSQNINKIVYIEKESNLKTIFYLLKNGEITSDSLNVNRFKNVNQKIIYYQNTEDINLEELAKNELSGQEYNHNLNIKLKADNLNFNVYEKVIFYDKNEVYNSIVTKKETINNEIYSITLGIVRNSLTEKLQKNTSINNTSNLSSGGGISSVKWGDIKGEILNQIDLNEILIRKVEKSTTINGQALLNNIELTADDVKAISTTELNITIPTLLDGKIKPEQLPALAITNVFVVNSQSAMLNLVAQEGDIAIRTDLNVNFILSDSRPYNLASWIELLTPPDKVLSVAKKIGNVDLDIEDINNLQNILDKKLYISSIDQNLSSSSTNPVQNKVIVAGLNDKLNKNQGAINSGKLMQVKDDGEVSYVKPMDMDIVPIVDNLSTHDSNSVASANTVAILNESKASNIFNFPNKVNLLNNITIPGYEYVRCSDYCIGENNIIVFPLVCKKIGQSVYDLIIYYGCNTNFKYCNAVNNLAFGTNATGYLINYSSVEKNYFITIPIDSFNNQKYIYKSTDLLTFIKDENFSLNNYTKPVYDYLNKQWLFLAGSGLYIGSSGNRMKDFTNLAATYGIPDKIFYLNSEIYISFIKSNNGFAAYIAHGYLSSLIFSAPINDVSTYNQIHQMEFGNEIFLINCDTGIYSTKDFTSFNKLTTIGGFNKFICYGNGIFLLWNLSSQIYYSTGLSFTQIQMPNHQYNIETSFILFNKNKFIFPNFNSVSSFSFDSYQTIQTQDVLKKYINKSDAESIGGFKQFARTIQTFQGISGVDNRGSAASPTNLMELCNNSSPALFTTEFAGTSILGLSQLTQSNYVQLLSFSPWHDSSGGLPHEIALDNFGMYLRHANDNSSWKLWEKISTITRGSVSTAISGGSHSITPQYYLFSNELVIQWGRVEISTYSTPAKITLPIAMNGTDYFVISGVNRSSSADSGVDANYASIISASQICVVHDYITNNRSNNAFWLVIGRKA